MKEKLPEQNTCMESYEIKAHAGKPAEHILQQRS